MYCSSRENRVNSIFVLVFMFVLLVYPALQRRLQAQLWHWWNGDTTQLEQYDIPVPAGWVAHQTAPGTRTLLEVETYPSLGEFRSTVFVSKGGFPKDVDIGSSLNEEALRSRGAQILDRRTVEFDGEKAHCLVSNALIHRLDVPSDMIISIECVSTAGLSITFNGDKKNIDTFFEVVSQMRKH